MLISQLNRHWTLVVGDVRLAAIGKAVLYQLSVF